MRRIRRTETTRNSREAQTYGASVTADTSASHKTAPVFKHILKCSLAVSRELLYIWHPWRKRTFEYLIWS